MRHSTPPEFHTPPVYIELAGAGATGSLILSGLVRLHLAMLELGHPHGLQVRCRDPDTVSHANIGRQLFTEYYLHFPNREVERSFNEQLLEYYAAVQADDAQQLISKLITSVGSGDVDGFMNQLKVMFANIPYNIHVANEHYYQTIFFVICDMLRFMVQEEICANDGRIDLMVAAGEWIYVMEFKLNKSAEDALEQIHNKEYALKYQRDGKHIMLLGVNFDSQSGQITNWLKEQIQ